MTDDLRAKEIFGDALELTGVERESFLDRACGGDMALRRRVRELIGAAERDEVFLGEATISGFIEPKDSRADERPGARIGPYTLLDVLGEGGFGMVYKAEQHTPVRRLVALKIIKLGMDTKAVVARFEQERQALAVMDHPGIAKVFDAGITSLGRPYFVMELVEGLPITAYCDRHNLTIPQRLDLFVQVCRAVQHAHAKGIIHRDLKPSNVLVGEQDGHPHARVIDFGIAKATDHRALARTLFTESSQLIGTPEYMSPEQAGGAPDIDTRTDVYSLGVLLYEVLIGATPFDARKLRSAAFAELQRIIREDDPPAPSTRLTQQAETLASVAASRRVEPARLASTIRGELDWIVMKTLEKERSRRYDTPGDLAEELERYLKGQPIAAAPASRLYLARKLLRRHRGLFAAGLAVVVSLVLGLVSTTFALFQAKEERNRAVKAEGEAKARFEEAETSRKETEKFNRIATLVSDFFTLDILDVRPLKPGEHEPTVSELLERVPGKIERYFKAEPAAEGVIRERVGQIYHNMGKPLMAQPYLEAAPALLEASLGPEHPRTISALRRLASMYGDLELYAKAEPIYDKVHQARLKREGPKYLFTWSSLADRGSARVRSGRTQEGLADLDTAIDKLTEIGYEATRVRLLVMMDRVECWVIAGNPQRAESLAREAIAEFRNLSPKLAGMEFGFRAKLGDALLALGRPGEALSELDTALVGTSSQFKPDDPYFVAIRISRAEALAALNRLAEARAEFESCYEEITIAYGERGPWARRLSESIVGVCSRQGDVEAAARWKTRQ